MAKSKSEWQLVLVLWGTGYGVGHVNALCRAVLAQSPRPPRRISLITDRPRPGLDPDILQVDCPAAFLRPWMQGSGCQTKLAMFQDGLLPDDLPAVYLDLDTVVIGDISVLIDQRRSDDAIALIQSAAVPFGPLGRLLFRLTSGKHYARGNSSVVVWQPGKCGFIADRFLALLDDAQNRTHPAQRADERFISWAAQSVMQAVSHAAVVKMGTEFMWQSLFWGRLINALPWRRKRHAKLVAVTLPGKAVKAETLLNLPPDAIIEDNKGRKLQWSKAYLGPIYDRILAGLQRDQAAQDPQSVSPSGGETDPLV